jgi:hypothetical protein
MDNHQCRYGGRNPYCVICNKTKKEKETTHIVPSGGDKSLCGLDSENIRFTSLGMTCTCKDCLRKAKNIMRMTNG